MRYKRDQDEAAASVNDGFLKILTNLKNYNPQVPFEAWIKRIMINHVIDEFRKNRKVKELIEYTDFSERNEASDPVNYNEADILFDAGDIEEMIKTLPPVTQKVFNLFAIDGYPHKDIAELLKMSEGTSKWHLNSARKKLKELLHKHVNAQKII